MTTIIYIYLNFNFGLESNDIIPSDTASLLPAQILPHSSTVVLINNFAVTLNYALNQNAAILHKEAARGVTNTNCKKYANRK